MMINHFGIKKKDSNNNRLCRDEYITISDLDLKNKDKKDYYRYNYFISNHKKDIETTFDLNMDYYLHLDKNDFNKHLNNYLKNNPDFVQVFDLREYNKVRGFYMLVLDDYKQVYIGKANNIKRRILEHWYGYVPFYSRRGEKILIDSFKCLDTTRIFVMEFDYVEKNIGKNIYDVENRLIKDFPQDYLCNGTVDGGIFLRRNAQKYIDVDKYEKRRLKQIIDRAMDRHIFEAYREYIKKKEMLVDDEAVHIHQLAANLEDIMKKFLDFTDYDFDVEYDCKSAVSNIPIIIVNKTEYQDNLLAMKIKEKEISEYDKFDIKKYVKQNNYKNGYCLSLKNGYICKYISEDDVWDETIIK